MNNNWATHIDLFNELNKEFNFTVDVCASSWNAKCHCYYGSAMDSLNFDWPLNSSCWMNPPYGRLSGDFIKHSLWQSQERNLISVGLVPANTETIWFQDFALKYGELRFVKKRIHFTDFYGNTGRPRFASVVVIFRPGQHTGFLGKPLKFIGGK